MDTMIKKGDFMICVDKTFHTTIGKSYKVVDIDRKRLRWYYMDDKNVLEYWHTDSSLTARCFVHRPHNDLGKSFRKFVRSVL